MKVIIAGSRDISDINIVEKAIVDSKFTISEVVCGGAVGIDFLGFLWAKNNNIPIKLFPADWNKHGKRAGYLRNVQMANYADGLIAIRKNNSKGTTHMINIAKEKNLKIYHIDI